MKNHNTTKEFKRIIKEDDNKMFKEMVDKLIIELLYMPKTTKFSVEGTIQPWGVVNGRKIYFNKKEAMKFLTRHKQDLKRELERLDFPASIKFQVLDNGTIHTVLQNFI